MRRLRTIAILLLAGLPIGCALKTASTRSPAPQERHPTTTGRTLDAKQTEQVQRGMVPLLRATNNPRLLNEIRVRVMDDPNINAANEGGGNSGGVFLSTRLATADRIDALRKLA
jgi:hypothetical protein